jgi:hypothetical protein
VELVVTNPIGVGGVLRIDGVFTSPDDKFNQTIQRSLVLEIQTRLPALVISSGVAYNGFDFQKLAVVSTTQGTPAAVKNRLELTDDTSWEPIAPVWLQNIRVAPIGEAGLYATFGTTPDRNIFKNAILGASVVVPRWRTTFTGGFITARGHEAEDLNPVRTQFSDADGFVLADTDLGKLPLPKTRWVKSPYASVSFVLVTF